MSLSDLEFYYEDMFVIQDQLSLKTLIEPYTFLFSVFVFPHGDQAGPHDSSWFNIFRSLLPSSGVNEIFWWMVMLVISS